MSPRPLAALTLGFLLAARTGQLYADTPPAAAPLAPSVRISNFLREAPCGIAWVINDSAAFVVDTGAEYVAGTAAPDDSYHAYKFNHDHANIVFEWGRVGNNVVARLSSDKPVDQVLTLSAGWPDWSSTFAAAADGATGTAQATGGAVHWTLKTSPAPKSATPSSVTVSIAPGAPARFVAGLTALPDPASVDDMLKKAKDAYEARRPKASGDLGDFVGAIADNMNNSRLYASDIHRVAHSVSRNWGNTPNACPFFCWDSFFTANLAAIEDPVVARDTVRTMLSYQSPSGLVPNFAHWRTMGPSIDRSQPPMASLCVWKMHERYPNDPADRAFLAEIYPKLVLWHDWWPKARDAKHDGLLEWGSADGGFQDAQYETGWDDNVEYTGAKMRGQTMNAYSVDLSSMWSMDANYLALIADFLGHKEDAVRFRGEHAAINQRINALLWNSGMNCYCSRLWDDAGSELPVDASAFGAGFAGQYYSDEKLGTPTVTHQDANLDFNWGGKSPLAGVAATNWSARWKATFTPPESGSYQFSAGSDDGVRVIVDGKTIIDNWSIHGANPPATGSITLNKGQAVPLVVEYFQDSGGSELHLSVNRIAPPNPQGNFLTRLTPMNFYPLIAGVPDAARAQLVLKVLTDPKKFWGQYLLPTTAYDDPDYHLQEYWRGDVWGPPNYITWQGIKKYGTPEEITEFADRSVALFMKNWLADGSCSENYLSTDGTHGRDPHYTWGALLDLIGLESIVDVDDSGQIVLNGAQTKNIMLANIPLLGKVYDVKTAPGSAQLLQNGKVVLEARGNIVRAAIR